MEATIYWGRLTSPAAAEVEGSRAAMAWTAQNPDGTVAEMLDMLGPVPAHTMFNPFLDYLLNGLVEEHRAYRARRLR